MSLAPTPQRPTPVGAEEEGGSYPPGTPSPLSAFCDCCGKPRRARELNLVCVQERQSYEPKWILLCGPCFVDGES